MWSQAVALTVPRGFRICHALAMRYPKKCLAVHTTNPVFAAPTMKRRPMLWLKYQLARLTKAKYPTTSFGYLPSEVNSVLTTQTDTAPGGRLVGTAMHQLFSLRPQTLAFSLCDSPVGLLAVMLDLVSTRNLGSSMNPRPRSPFLDPGELEMQDRECEAAGHERVRSDETVKASHNGGRGEDKLGDRRSWSSRDVLNWTMMYVACTFSAAITDTNLTVGCGFQAPRRDFAGYAELISRQQWWTGANTVRYLLVSAIFKRMVLRHR